MATTTTPNLGLTVPTPGSEPGPQYAQEVSQNFNVIDDEVYSPNNPVHPDGLDLDDDIDLQDINNINRVRALRLASQPVTETDPADVSQIYGVLGDLYWNNANGTPVKITNGTGINAAGIAVSTWTSINVTSDLVIGAAATYTTLFVNTGAPWQISLPKASTQNPGRIFLLVDGTGQAYQNNITLTPDPADTIDGVGGSITLKTSYGVWLVVTDGASKWNVLYSQPDRLPAVDTYTIGGTLAFVTGSTISGATDINLNANVKGAYVMQSPTFQGLFTIGLADVTINTSDIEVNNSFIDLKTNTTLEVDGTSEVLMLAGSRFVGPINLTGSINLGTTSSETFNGNARLIFNDSSKAQLQAGTRFEATGTIETQGSINVRNGGLLNMFNGATQAMLSGSRIFGIGPGMVQFNAYNLSRIQPIIPKGGLVDAVRPGDGVITDWCFQPSTLATAGGGTARYFLDAARYFLTGTTANRVRGLVLECDEGLLDGQYLTSIDLYMTVGQTHVALPVASPTVTVDRLKITGITAPPTAVESVVVGGVSFTTLADWNSTSVQKFNFTPVSVALGLIDKANYMYIMRIQDETGTNSLPGNLYQGVKFNYTSINALAIY